MLHLLSIGLFALAPRLSATAELVPGLGELAQGGLEQDVEDGAASSVPS